MDVSQYYITTLMNAATKIGPLLAFIIGGYFLFVKLPFFFFLKNMNISKKEYEQQNPNLDYQKDYSVKNYEDFQRRMKLMNTSKEAPKLKAPEAKKEEAKKEEPKKEKKKEEPKQQKKQEFKQERKTEVKKDKPQEKSAEVIFEIKPGFTKEELRKRYHELLRQNHPDKVANLGEDFKKLADQNTKEINKAYEKLKSKAA